MRTLNIVTYGVLLALLVGVAGASPASADDRGTPPEGAEASERFGISAEKFNVRKGHVSQHQTFTDLLSQYGVSRGAAVRLARASRSVFDVRDIKTGQPYHVYMNPWLEQAQYVVYEISRVKHVVFDVRRPKQTHIERQPIERRWTMVRGTIESSLYETLTANDVHPNLALRLSEVFAWQIDFFRIRSGDSFRILYEKRLVDGKRLAPGKILAASFDHQGERFFGFRFDDGSGPRYFDRRGQSLQRKLLKAPLQYSRISSGFSHSRYHPILKRRRPHLGTDYAAPRGTPVHSVGGGTVVKAGHYGPNGNYVKIRHNGTYTSGYLHLYDIADGVVPGAEVKQEETIGYVGSTGRSTGPHLDYRLWKRGEPVDPYEIELPPSRPVRPQYQAVFDDLVDKRMEQLYPLRIFQPDRRGLS